MEDGFDVLESADWGNRGLTAAETAARDLGEAPPGWMRWSQSGRRRVSNPLVTGRRGGPAAAMTVTRAWVHYQRDMLSGVPDDAWWRTSVFGFQPSRSDLTPMTTAWGHQMAAQMRPRGQQHMVYTMCAREQRPSWAEYLMWVRHGEGDWPKRGGTLAWVNAYAAIVDSRRSGRRASSLEDSSSDTTRNCRER